MNNKIIFLLAIVVILFGSCSNEKDYKVYRIDDLSMSISDTLTFVTEGSIVGVEVLITGYINGMATLEIDNGAGRFHTIDLNENVNEVYETEWYSTNLSFKYIPIETITGDSLLIRYRMY